MRQLVAIIVTILLLMGVVGPALAAPGGGGPGRWVGEQLRKAVPESTRWITEGGKRKRLVLDRVAEAKRVQEAKTPEALDKRIAWLKSFSPLPADLVLQAELRKERMGQSWWRRLLPMTIVRPEAWAPPARPPETPPISTKTLPAMVPAVTPPAAPGRPGRWLPSPTPTWRPPTTLATPVAGVVAGILVLMARALGFG